MDIKALCKQKPGKSMLFATILYTIVYHHHFMFKWMREEEERNRRKHRQRGWKGNVPNRLRLRRGGGGGVGGCGVFAPRREISTSTRETVSPTARTVADGRKEKKKRERRK